MEGSFGNSDGPQVQVVAPEHPHTPHDSKGVPG